MTNTTTTIAAQYYSWQRYALLAAKMLKMHTNQLHSSLLKIKTEAEDAIIQNIALY
jgi:phosphoribosylcarboxyaminoimidazole (NCAIR) mutase